MSEVNENPGQMRSPTPSEAEKAAAQKTTQEFNKVLRGQTKNVVDNNVMRKQFGEDEDNPVGPGRENSGF